MKKLKVYILVLVGIVSIIPFEYTHAQQATWIWYPGDYDIWLGNQVQNRRTQRGTFFPHFWKM